MSNKNQSSVEWLQEQFINSGLDYPINQLGKIFEQAKEMHKEEIKEAYYNGGNYEDLTKNEILEIAEQYYNEIFNNE